MTNEGALLGLIAEQQQRVYALQRQVQALTAELAKHQPPPDDGEVPS